MAVSGVQWFAFITPFLAVTIAIVLKVYREKRRAEVSLHWPIVEGTFTDGTVEAYDYGDSGSGRAFKLTVIFSYTIESVHRQGTYTEYQLGEVQAHKMLELLQVGPLLVRVDPRAPHRYFVDPYRDVRR